MREIKFRAWVTEYADEENSGYMINLPANKLYFDCEDGFVLAFGKPEFWACECYERRNPKFEVMQYTGLRDKNGKEIYELDVLEDTNKVLYQVIYSATCFKLKVLKSNHIKFDVGDEVFFYTRTKEYSIIGNSFQNTELLTTTVK